MGLLVVGFLLFASFIRCAWASDRDQGAGSCLCVFSCQLFIIIVITSVSLFLWTVLTCDPREPLLWSQSERGSICEKTETETCSNHSPAHPVSVSGLQRACLLTKATP